MGYIRAEEVLPPELLERLQDYVEGCAIYVPKRQPGRRAWGVRTGIRQELTDRNAHIRAEYRAGDDLETLMRRYCLSDKSIQRILREDFK